MHGVSDRSARESMIWIVRWELRSQQTPVQAKRRALRACIAGRGHRAGGFIGPNVFARSTRIFLLRLIGSSQLLRWWSWRD
jgi:hypothetical protein